MSPTYNEVPLGTFILGRPEDTQSSNEPPVSIPIVSERRDSLETESSFDSACTTLNKDHTEGGKTLLTRRSSVFTEELPQHVELEFLRDGWANRIITDKDGKPLYFADIPWQWTGTKLDIYRGSPETEKAIASLSRKVLGKRSFYHFHQEDERIEIIGSKMYLGFDYYFNYNGHQYRWREKPRRFKCSQDEILTDTQTKEVIARFKNVSLLQTWRNRKYGKLVIYNEDWKNDEKLVDVAVMTLVAVKQRIREKKRMRGFWKALVAAGEGAAGN